MQASHFCIYIYFNSMQSFLAVMYPHTQNQWICIILLLFATSISATAVHFDGLDVLRPFSTPEKQEQAVYGLIGRIFGSEYKRQFTLKVDPALIGDSQVVLIDRGPQETIQITSGSGIGVAWGVNHFLRNCCAAHLSWDGNRISLPPSLPHPASRATHHSIGRFLYFSNVCTFSYSFVFWDWKTWERHIDWLALNGVNLPLAIVATEAIYQRVYQKLGLSQADIDAFFTGPAFLAWHRMGNLKAFAGALSQNWHQTQVNLQHKILERMVELGMVPVLSAFSGHVPDVIEKLYPNANLTILKWSVFNCTYTCIRFLEPTDPLFFKIGTMFLTEMKKEFGLYHAYSADLFNEMRPRSYDKTYVDAIGKAVYRTMTTVDPDAVWVMQAWMFVGDSSWRQNDSARSLLTSVPMGKLLLLDINSEQRPVFQYFDSFYGQPYVWNVLHNSGGVQGFFGAVSKINNYLYNATEYPNNSLVGVGLTMEGIYQNYPIYQFTLDRAWSHGRQKLDQAAWIVQYVQQRYGNYQEWLQNAWHLLWTTVYDQQNQPGAYRYSELKKREDITYVRISPMTNRPSLTLDSEPGYDPKILCTAWKYFVHHAETHPTNNSLFHLDLVDITRESLMMMAAAKYRLLIQSYTNKDMDKVATFGNQLLQLLDEVEQILETHQHFLFGRWILEARSKGKTRADQDLFEYNIRNQITLWGPTGIDPDYAKKEWAGLISGYYRPRWLLFVNALLDSLLPGGAPYSQDRYNQVVFTLVEQPFTFKRGGYPSQPRGDSVNVAKKLMCKYESQCKTVS